MSSFNLSICTSHILKRVTYVARWWIPCSIDKATRAVKNPIGIIRNHRILSLKKNQLQSLTCSKSNFRFTALLVSLKSWKIFKLDRKKRKECTNMYSYQTFIASVKCIMCSSRDCPFKSFFIFYNTSDGLVTWLGSLLSIFIIIKRFQHFLICIFESQFWQAKKHVK